MSHTDPAHSLQASARKFAKHVSPSRPANKVTLSDDHGDIASLLIPVHENDVVTQPVAAVEGWDFSGAVPRFDGTVVCGITGRKLEVLKALAASDEPLDVNALRAAWNGARVEDNSVRWQIMALREALQTAFPGLADPILTTPNGYLLTVK